MTTHEHNRIDLLIIPRAKKIQPGDHLTDVEAAQVRRDWANHETVHSGQFWTVGIAHGAGRDATITTLRIPRS